MWLPKTVYESLPPAVAASGVAAIVVAVSIDLAILSEVFIVCGIGLIVAGLTLALRRKSYRASRSRIDFSETS